MSELVRNNSWSGSWPYEAEESSWSHESEERVQMNIENAAHSGRMSTLTCAEVKEQIDQRIRDNRRISTDEAASGVSTTEWKERCKNDIWPNQKRFTPENLETPWSLNQLNWKARRLPILLLLLLYYYYYYYYYKHYITKRTTFLSFKEEQVILVKSNMLNVNLKFNIVYHPPL